ncbi:hypothetical protein Dsin_004462 [Dipteronia sinensis]|uniref:RRM domain-containing protein n=1 Tax=Dipteronia sinensis TaxID=43782 RepID=A0AAE0AVH1_9ROSI|nr:hypothetical protein Dsin_004462 [Dipteronia sinensis]
MVFKIVLGHGYGHVVAKTSGVYPKDAEFPSSGVDDLTKMAYLHELLIPKVAMRRENFRENPRERDFHARWKGERKDFRDNLFSVFIDNLNPVVNLVCLWGIFRPFGKVRDVFLSAKNRSRRSLFAFIRFETLEEANKVAHMVNGMHIYGWTISSRVATYGWRNRRTMAHRHPGGESPEEVTEVGKREGKRRYRARVGVEEEGSQQANRGQFGPHVKRSFTEVMGRNKNWNEGERFERPELVETM